MMQLAKCLGVLLTLCVALPGRSHAQDAASAGELDPLKLQEARANWIKAKNVGKVYYTKKFDLSGLPEYKPAARMSGTIRQWGSNYIADSMLGKYLEEGFRKYHPEVRFEDNLKSTFIGMAGLYTGQADLAPMGRRPTWDELQGYQRIFASAPVEIAMATGSYDVPGWTFALTVFVNKDNPIGKLTLEQLDGIFGAERDGGWVDNKWVADARGPEKNIRTWGQLGLTGEWADKPIHVYAYNLNYHFPRDFSEKVMKGGYKWNEKLKEYGNKAEPDGSALISAGTQLAAEVSKDPYGITYAAINYGTPQVKPLALAATAAGPYVAPTIDSVQNRSYPLSREVYYYANRPPGKKIDPLVKEFLRYVLSREGQEAVQRDGKYLPLTAQLAREQLKKLDEIGKKGGLSE
jgi:phosphate transport system substrate-binding protein